MTNETQTNSQRVKVQAATLEPALQERVLAMASDKEWSAAKTAGWLIKFAFQKLDEQRNAQPQQSSAAA
jgi:hypothetical protein